MRILAIYVDGGRTEWCRVVGHTVAGGVIPGDGMWVVIEQALNDGLLGSDEDPLNIAIAGDYTDAHYGRLEDIDQWDFITPGVEVTIYEDWDHSAAARRAVRRWAKPVEDALREHGLLDHDAPAYRAAVLALDMARRLS